MKKDCPKYKGSKGGTRGEVNSIFENDLFLCEYVNVRKPSYKDVLILGEINMSVPVHMQEDAPIADDGRSEEEDEVEYSSDDEAFESDDGDYEHQLAQALPSSEVVSEDNDLRLIDTDEANLSKENKASDTIQDGDRNKTIEIDSNARNDLATGYEFDEDENSSDITLVQIIGVQAAKEAFQDSVNVNTAILLG